MKIEIFTTYDTTTCGDDNCCYDEAYGGEVFIDGEFFLERTGKASIYGGESYSEMDLLCMALKEKGISVFINNFEYKGEWESYLDSLERRSDK